MSDAYYVLASFLYRVSNIDNYNCGFINKETQEASDRLNIRQPRVNIPKDVENIVKPRVFPGK